MPLRKSARPSTPAADPFGLRPPGHKWPKTDRGVRTRRRVLDASLEVFSRDGFVGARVADVAAEAGVSLGTVYSYFDDKADLLASLLEGVFVRLYEGSRAPLTGPGRVDELYAGLYHYLSVYAGNRSLMRVLMEATAVDERFAGYWFGVRSRFLARIIRSVRAVQDAGDVPGDLDPVTTASALGGMVDNFAWIWFGLGGERDGAGPARARLSPAEAAWLLTRLWVRALFLEDPPGMDSGAARSQADQPAQGSRLDSP